MRNLEGRYFLGISLTIKRLKLFMKHPIINRTRDGIIIFIHICHYQLSLERESGNPGSLVKAGQKSPNNDFTII